MKKIDLTGKIALITGGTRGIGQAIVQNFIDAGANTIVTGTMKDGKDLLLRTIKNLKNNKNIEYLIVDFQNKEQVYSFLNVLKSKDRIDICVNNAGTNQIRMIKDICFSDIENLHKVNLYAPFLILSIVLEKMKKHRWGRVVNIGSLWSKLSREGRSIYSSSKYGLMGLTVTAALEYASFNVLVNMVSPGFVLTDLSKVILSKKEKEDIERKIPVGRFAKPIDIANMVLFLTSEMNSYITGQNIIVDGGYICE